MLTVALTFLLLRQQFRMFAVDLHALACYSDFTPATPSRDRLREGSGESAEALCA
jgi:hypothetical protein